jgi:23S rRNA pseudouridine2605 synthase
MAEERLQKFLARAGVASRRASEVLITAGRVKVNNQIVSTLGAKVDPQKDLVSVDNKPVLQAEETRWYVMYKPPQVMTTMDDPQGRPTVKDYLGHVKERVYPVGRLDWDAEGALLFTNDGDIAHKLTHPKFGVGRTYLAKVKGDPGLDALEKLMKGVRLEDGPAKADVARVFEKADKNTWLVLTVSEGRQHLVKRLCAAVGYPVVRLFRPAHAGIGVHGLRPGGIRKLLREEIELVKGVAQGSAPPPIALKLPARRHGRAGGNEDTEEEASAPRGPPRRDPRSPAPQRRGSPAASHRRR